MEDSVPRIHPRPAIVPAGSSRDPRRRRRRREPGRPSVPESPRTEGASKSSNPQGSPSHDSDIGRAAPGEPGTNLDLTA